MKKNIIPILLGGFILASVAEAAGYNSIQADKSSLGFVFKQMGVLSEGHFNKFSAQLSFNPANLTVAKATIDLDLASIDTGYEEGNDEVRGKDWFDTKAFPHAKFESTNFKSLGSNHYEVSGKMSIKGRTQTISTPFTFSQHGNTAVVDGTFVLKRADYAIGEGSWSDFDTVANEVQIKFHFLAIAEK